MLSNAKNYRLQDTIIQFLNGLNDYLSTVKSQILLMDSLPSLNKVFSIIIQRERHGNLSIGEEKQSVCWKHRELLQRQRQ